MKTKRITIDCDPTDYEIITEFAFRWGLTLSEAIHIALDGLMDEAERETEQRIANHFAEDRAVEAATGRNKMM